MTNVFAIIFLIVFAIFAFPHIKRGEWIAPTAAPYEWWGFEYAAPGSRELLATPKEGYGWFRFDIWNNPPRGGRPVQWPDFSLRR